MAGFNNDVVFAQQGMRIGDITISDSDLASIQFEEDSAPVSLLINNTSVTPAASAYLSVQASGSANTSSFIRVAQEGKASFCWGITGTSSAPNVVLYYSNTDTVSPLSSSNQPVRIDTINVGTGSSRMVVKTQLAIAAEGTGSALLDINSNAAVGVTPRIQFTSLSGTDDAFIGYGMSGNNYAWGVDATASNAFFLTQAAVTSWPPSASNTIMKSTTAGEVTFPLTPAFLATHGVAQNNVTGNATVVTVNFTTEVFDQNGDYDGTNTFTAPVTGRYYLQSSVNMSELDATSAGGLQNITTSNRTYQSNYLNVGAARSGATSVSPNQFSFCMSALADMDAADTAIVRVYVDGMAGNTVDINALASSTYFSGFLQC